MTARIIDGKALAAELSQCIADAVRRMTTEHGVEPGLAVVLVGDNPASEIYVRSKTAKTAATNMRSLFYKLPATAAEAELLELIERLNRDPTVHGILVQLPLPPQIASRKVIEAIAPAKDVDGFHPLTAGCCQPACLASCRARRLPASCSQRKCMDRSPGSRP